MYLCHGSDVNAKVREVFGEFGIHNHVILIVGIDVCSIGSDGAQLHRQRVFGLLIVLNSMVVAPRTCKVVKRWQYLFYICSQKCQEVSGE